ncbi:MAG TPA: membrane protein insertase YidC [Desulfomonilia bacterium]|nr:membrane protein insertase YidC [Desulfomonilia bacterium]
MEKRTLLAIVLSMAILFVWGILFDQTKIKGTPEPKQKTAAAVTPSRPAQNPNPISAAPAVTPEVSARAGGIIIVDTPLYTAAFNTKGAQITSLKLKKYLTSMGKDAKPVEIIKTPMPSLLLSDGFSDKGLLYDVSEPGAITLRDNPKIIEFRTEASPGVMVKKTFTLDPKIYPINYQCTIENRSAAPITYTGGILFSNIYPLGEKRSGYAFEGPVLLNGTHLEEFKLDKVKSIGSYRDFSGELQWFGYEDKYFLHVIIPKVVESTTVDIRRVDDKSLELRYALASATIQPGSSLTRDNIIFIGPKEIKTLKSVGYNLNKALDFGFFDIIAKPLLIAMNWIHKYVGSYGWTIIILTILIKLVLYPLTLKSFTSMKELQKIQPLMKEIQQQYKDDKQKMNQELMKLYQEHKINPMGGCLPMLLQIPILFALYRVFYQAIELRHTPFHLAGTWLPDLSAPDPYYITPILMGASQFIMQKMTPTGGDPTQQKIMLIMPVVFTYMFLYFPSGLVLYWLVSNVLSIAQQAYINRKHT